jgi:thioredoxin reductase
VEAGAQIVARTGGLSRPLEEPAPESTPIAPKDLPCLGAPLALTPWAMKTAFDFDVVVVGGGPAGLTAGLILGRSLNRVLLCDAGPPRNAAAEHIQGFVTRDGTPPSEFRRIGREQLRPYGVQVRDGTRVESVVREGAGFRVSLGGGESVSARHVLLATGMVDVLPELPGYRELWGKSVFQCPYCHGWEVRGRPWGVLATSEHMLEFALFITGWTPDVVLFTDGAFSVTEELRERLHRAGVRLEERRVRALLPRDGHLEAVELQDGTRVPREVLFTRPPQRQPPLVQGLVQELGLVLDESGFVKVDPQGRTSVPGLWAAGDLTTMLQGAQVSGTAGAWASYAMNHELNMERAARGG